MKPSIDDTSKKKGGGAGWSMPEPWHNNTPTVLTADTHVEGKHACQRALEYRQIWWMAWSSHEATCIQTCSDRAEGDVWSAPPGNTESPIHTLQQSALYHQYASQQLLCNTRLVCMWLWECALLIASWGQIRLCIYVCVIFPVKNSAVTLLGTPY